MKYFESFLFCVICLIAIRELSGIPMAIFGAGALLIGIAEMTTAMRAQK